MANFKYNPTDVEPVRQTLNQFDETEHYYRYKQSGETVYEARHGADYDKFSQKFNNNVETLLKTIRDTVISKNHYYSENTGVQTIDIWDSSGSLSTSARDTAIKYLCRYGKKEGNNPKDLLKAIHYIMMIYVKNHM